MDRTTSKYLICLIRLKSTGLIFFIYVIYFLLILILDLSDKFALVNDITIIT